MLFNIFINNLLFQEDISNLADDNTLLCNKNILYLVAYIVTWKLFKDWV